MRSSRLFFTALPAICVACSFTGLGNYDIATCPDPVGPPTSIGNVSSQANDLTFSNTTGSDAIGAFVTSGTMGACVAGIESVYRGNTGLIPSSSTCFFATMNYGGGAQTASLGAALAPQQPSAAPLGGGAAVAVVATTNPSAPCTQGQIWFDYTAPPNVENWGSEPTCTATGSSLPAVASLGGTTALAAWYQTSIATRADPIGTCVGATAAPLVVATVNAGTNPVAFATPVVLTSQSTSVRPPALVIPSSPLNSVLLAAPNGGDVGVWTLDAALKPGPPVSIPGLGGARAVSMATDGGNNIAVVAEIGCSPQTIKLAVGTLSGGFSQVTTVAEPNGSQVQPTVVWVQAETSWIVSWIYVSGGPHARAMRFDANGNAEGGVIDPGVNASGAGALAGGNLLAYTSAGGFVTASLGCAE